MEVKVSRTIVNLYLIGKTIKEDGKIIIQNPYEIIMGMEGIQMIPMDQHILGKELEKAVLHENDVIYSEPPSEKIRNTYLETISGIEVPENNLIL